MENEETLLALKDSLSKIFPEKTIVNISDYEDDSNQTYKYLYESLAKEQTNMVNEIAQLRNEISNKDRAISENMEEIERLNQDNKALKNSSSNIISMLEEFTDKDVVISNVNVSTEDDSNDLRQFGANEQVDILKKTISDNPGVYGLHRPSWFTPLNKELSKKNVINKNKVETLPTLKNKLLFWKEHTANNIEEAEQYANEYDQKRMENILELLDSKCSNEEMYLKYMLLSPGLDKDYYSILSKAQSIGIDARILISLLEQPGDYFNKNIIEMYVSELHKGSEYDYKQALAEELIAGKWIIKAKMGEKEEMFQLMPVSVIESFNSTLESVKDCAKLAQTEKLDIDNGEGRIISLENMANMETSDTFTEDMNNNTTIDIQFDDSLLF